MSPNPIWNIILVSLGLFITAHLFIISPLAYLFLVRPFDKIFIMKNYVMEKGFWHISIIARLTNYSLGIVLQPYRNEKVRRKIFAKIIKRQFDNQDALYSKIVNFRKQATKFQLVLAYLLFAGSIVIILMPFVFILHDVIIYPDVGLARFNEINSYR